MQEAPRYVSVVEAIVRVLKDMGGEGEVDTVLRVLWRRYVKGGNGERVVMRLYRSPAGKLWSPDAEEALKILVAAGVVQLRDGKLVLRKDVN